MNAIDQPESTGLTGTDLDHPRKAWLFWSNVIGMWYGYHLGRIIAVGYTEEECRANVRIAFEEAKRNPNKFEIRIAPKGVLNARS